jgi:hypothetical protein
MEEAAITILAKEAAEEELTKEAEEEDEGTTSSLS